MVDVAKTIHLTINNRPVLASPGETVYQVAKKAGISIPSLCVSHQLAPFGSCRLCICEIDGQSGTPASCTTPVRPDMVVRTESDRLRRHRHNIVELYMSEQPEGSETSGPLRELALACGVDRVRYPDGAHQKRAVVRDDSNPFFTFDNAACISCARCVRACDEIQGTHALTMFGRGFSARPVAGAGSLMSAAAAFATSNCVSCGACVKECPTSALTEKTVLEQGVPTSIERTICAYCGVGCAFNAGVRDGRVVQMIPADDGPSNQGHACMKGRFGWTYNDAPDRLRVPLLRRGNDWEEISWDAALDRVAQEFTDIKNADGPDALATISSSRGTNEENYLFGKFMRCVIGTNHIDNCARVCHS
ncbi:MAG: (2Fe-2S)-binding protein, partial [Nitrospirae bacterium]|nr:(2Fe-2S)-binding protein [Nitrospirota bacterium]